MMADDRVDAAVIAHDLRNLLQITASALLQIDRHLDIDTRSRVLLYEHAASESLARAGALSRALVDRAAGSEGDGRQSVCPAQAVAAIRHLIELAVGPSVRVDFEIGDDLPSVACDPQSLERALLNLVSNARDAMPGGGNILISVAQEQGAAVLRVRDTGPGIDPELAAQLFRPFFTTRGVRGGSGLGLAMVKRFAEQSGGMAEIGNADGCGTVVTLRLPATRRPGDVM